jgi:hypothetical protein
VSSDKNQGLGDTISNSASVKVELLLSNIENTDDIYGWIKQIANPLRKLAISNINVNDNKVSFDLAKQNKEKIEAREIGPELREVIQSIKLPFEVKEGKVIGDDMWSWD